MLDNSTVGNNEQPLLFLTHPIDEPAGWTPLAPGAPTTVTHISTITQWRKVAKNVVSSIRVILQDTLGFYTLNNEITNPLLPPAPPLVPCFPTTVQMILRQVSD
jgi:hypothetical protein